MTRTKEIALSLAAATALTLSVFASARADEASVVKIYSDIELAGFENSLSVAKTLDLAIEFSTRP